MRFYTNRLSHVVSSISKTACVVCYLQRSGRDELAVEGLGEGGAAAVLGLVGRARLAPLAALRTFRALAPGRLQLGECFILR